VLKFDYPKQYEKKSFTLNESNINEKLIWK